MRNGEHGASEKWMIRIGSPKPKSAENENQAYGWLAPECNLTP